MANLKTSRKLYYYLLLLIIILGIICFSIQSYKKIESIILLTTELNKIFENWLIVKNETVKYIMSENKYPYDLIESVSAYETSMEKIIDKNILSSDDKNIQSIKKELPNMIRMWQDIQFTLIKSIFYSNNFDIFANEIFYFITETDDFEISTRKTLGLFNKYLSNRVKVHWILFVSVIGIIIIIGFLVGHLIYNYLKIIEKEKNSKELTNSIIKIQDKERIRIAADLHDVIAQNLLAIKQICNEIFSQTMEKAKILGLVNTIKILLDKNISSIREISFNLRPPELLDTLEKTIQSYSEEISSKNKIEIDSKCFGFNNYTIDENIEITIYRLICEAVNNIIKHANASKIIIRIIIVFPFILLKIQDNGKGFIYNNKIKTKNHMGIQSMESRVKLIDGTMEIKSGEGNGTSIIIKIPCKGLIKENGEK